MQLQPTTYYISDRDITSCYTYIHVQFVNNLLAKMGQSVLAVSLQ